MERQIIKLPIQSFCFGVKNAIKETKRIIDNPNTKKPIHMLGELVHNKYVSAYFEECGLIVHKQGTRLEMLNTIPDGTVIFTAHGVSPQVIQEAHTKGLIAYNASCPFVKNSIKLIQKYLNNDYYVLYIGSKNHPESETALSLSNKVILIETLSDAKNLFLEGYKLVITNQTTMSIYDIYEIVDYLTKKYPNIIIMEKVCNAAKERQEMIFEVAKKHQNEELTAFIVVGDKLSHNTNKLADIIKVYNKNIYFAETIEDLDLSKLTNFNTIYITSGTSTPLAIVDEIYNVLRDNPNKKIVKSKLQAIDYVKE